jgi:hypothetical protein
MTPASDGLDQVFAELGGQSSFDADSALPLALGVEQPREV